MASGSEHYFLNIILLFNIGQRKSKIKFDQYENEEENNNVINDLDPQKNKIEYSDRCFSFHFIYPLSPWWLSTPLGVNSVPAASGCHTFIGVESDNFVITEFVHEGFLVSRRTLHIHIAVRIGILQVEIATTVIRIRVLLPRMRGSRLRDASILLGVLFLHIPKHIPLFLDEPVQCIPLTPDLRIHTVLTGGIVRF
jgi:hypothetical protein